jgi:hypothetical protein
MISRSMYFKGAHRDPSYPDQWAQFYNHNEDGSDSIAIKFTVGPGQYEISMKLEEYMEWLDVACSIVDAVVYRCSDDADSEL